MEKSTTDKTILYEKHNQVALITLNRPEQYNALTLEMRNELLAVLGDANKDKSIRAVVITGAGRGFSAGADLNEMATGAIDPMDVRDDLMLTYANVVKRIMYLQKPVIAAINGSCAGAALGIALACDFKIMAAAASMRYAFINIALVPDAGSSWFLVRAVGYNKAMEIIIGGEKIPAKECLRLGLINQVVATEDTLSEAMAFANKLANGPTKAILGTKNILNYAMNNGLNDTIDVEAAEQAKLIFGRDNMEGVTAFLQKRKPNFTGE